MPGDTNVMQNYNGNATCTNCGEPINPVQAMFTAPTPLCPPCSKILADQQVKGMMSGA
jgi:predicted nucleic acid-binding Zn ribbon protein